MKSSACIALLSLLVSLTSAATFQDISSLRKPPTTYPSSSLDLVKLGNKNYFFDLNQKMNWMEARTFCRDFDMDLLSVETAEEDQLITQHITEIGKSNWNFWTSGNKIGRQRYGWLNGRDLEFTNWGMNQPMNVATENCVMYWNGQWFDAACDDRDQLFICEER